MHRLPSAGGSIVNRKSWARGERSQGSEVTAVKQRGGFISATRANNHTTAHQHPGLLYMIYKYSLQVAGGWSHWDKHTHTQQDQVDDTFHRGMRR